MRAAGWRFSLVAAVMVVAGAASGEHALDRDAAEGRSLDGPSLRVAAWDSVHPDARHGTGAPSESAPPTAEPHSDPAPHAVPCTLATVNGVVFVWPDLDAPAYADQALEPLRRVLAQWRGGAASEQAVPASTDSPPALYLAADVTFLHATAGRADYFSAAAAYEWALRATPDFPDAARAQFMLGHTNLLLGFGPEAGAAFSQLERRFPRSPLVLDARLGRAAALRLRRRPVEARRLIDQVLETAGGEVLCRARLEVAASERAAGTPTAAAAAFRQLAATCPATLERPGVLLDFAEVLVQAGDRDGGRALLTAPRPPRDRDEEGRLQLLAGMLAEDGGAARVAYERVLGSSVSPAVAIEAKRHLALLDAGDQPEQAARALAALAGRATPRSLRVAILGEAADAYARAARFDEALQLLDRARRLGAEGRVLAEGRRGELLGRWIAVLAARDDAAGIATLYAAYTTDVHELTSPEDQLTVARALARIGLHTSAVRVLERASGPAPRARPEIAAVLAEEALAAGDLETAKTVAARLLEGPLPEDLATRLRRTVAQATLRAGDVEGAAAATGDGADMELRAEVASALLARSGSVPRARELLGSLRLDPEVPVPTLLRWGAAAAAAGAWEAAEEAYGAALLRAANGLEKIEAGAGVARAARARGDDASVAAAFAEVSAASNGFLAHATATASRALAPDGAR